MDAGDPEIAARSATPRRTTWTAIREKLDRLLHNADNRALDPFRVEVAGIIETLDEINRDVDGLRGRGLRGDLHRD